MRVHYSSHGLAKQCTGGVELSFPISKIIEALWLKITETVDIYADH